MKPRVGSAVKLAGLTLATLSIAGIGYSYHAYPGLTTRLLDHTREATWAESRNLYQCLVYWVRYMERLRLDEATGTYGFAARGADGARGFDACTMDFHRGDFGAAVACMEAELEHRDRGEEELFWLAMSYLRLAEQQNCLEEPARRADGEPADGSAHPAAHAHATMCALPIGRHHERTEPSLRAALLFEELLDRHDPENRLYRWLLNFSYMTVDGFPDGVPERHLIQTPFIRRFYGEAADESARRHHELVFVERAGELGVDTPDTGRGVAVEDFDRDGDLDIVTGGAFDFLRFYDNDGGAFVERTAAVGLGGVTQTFSISAADYDNDGWIDLFVARPFHHYALFRNRGDGSFEDVSEAAGLLATLGSNQVAASWTSAWGDVDLDGDLDLFLAQWGMRLPFVKGLLGRPRMDSKLFVNEGGVFSDRTREFGLARLVRDQYYVGAAFGDFDGDGYPDLFLSSPVRLASALVRNVGGLRFEPVELIERTESGFYAAFVDVNHDGRLDIFQGGFGDARTSTELAVFGHRLGVYKSGNSTILLQRDDGSFAEHNEFFEADMPMATMGASYGDLNNDGCFDFYLGTGNPESWFVLPNLMYLGKAEGRRCSGRMENISMIGGFGTIQKGHGIVFFDFDGDGDEDVYSSLGGMWPADRWPNQLFVNESRLGNSWMKIRLRGRSTNHFGVGARITVVAEAPDGSEIVRRAVMDNKTGFGSSPYLAHVGLLDARAVRRVEVYWPVSKCLGSYPATLNQLNVLDEDTCRSSPQET